MRRSNAQVAALLRRAFRHDRRAIAQLMSLAENDPHARMDILAKLYWRGKESCIIGITGPPGCGKSTLIAQLTKYYSNGGSSVGIVAVDPSSQITGGALLGDRIRMGELAGDENVYIRSMATRGEVGGVARATGDAVRIFAATSNDYVIVETAGAGQSDVEVKGLVDTTVVVTSPGLGDEIQALKAGIMEIGDIFVVNKADREGADEAVREIYSMVAMAPELGGWRPHVLKTIATTGEGVAGLAAAISQHNDHVRNRTANTDVEKARADILGAAKLYFEEIELKKIESSIKFKKILDRVTEKKLDPYSAARTLIDRR